MRYADGSGTGCRFTRLGCVEYLEARKLQADLAGHRVTGEEPDTLLLLEHPPTFTLGCNTDEANLLVSRQWAADHQIAVHTVDRGGDITFHGPGQLVGYPVMQMKNSPREAVCFIRSLEAVLINVLDRWGVAAGRMKQPSGRGYYSGVWVEGEKIGAIGIKVTGRGVSQHGFALNVNTDLAYFQKIIPCGLKGKAVTSLSRILGREVAMECVIDAVIESFQREFRVRPV